MRLVTHHMHLVTESSSSGAVSVSSPSSVLPGGASPSEERSDSSAALSTLGFITRVVSGVTPLVYPGGKINANVNSYFTTLYEEYKVYSTAKDVDPLNNINSRG